MDMQAKPIYKFGPFHLDASERVLLRDGSPVSLTPKALETLIVLVEHSGHLVEKDALMKAVWPDAFVEEGGLTRNISVLRKILGDNSEEQAYIETLPRRGYRFTCVVKELLDEGADLIVTRRRRLRILTEEGEIDGEDEMENWTSKRLSLKAAVRSLAVVPFKLLNSGDADQYLGLGITDALITKLSVVRQIMVRPTSAVLKYAGLKLDPVEVGRQMHVESVLEGSIQKLDDRIRVTVQLVSVEDDTSLWAEKFDEKFIDIFAVQDSISEQVVKALTLRLSGAERKLLAKHQTDNTEAYQAYLKGRYFWNKNTDDWFRKALECFHQAIEIDPGYALAYVGLADCYNLSGFWGFLPIQETFAKAVVAAEKALELDDTLAEAHESLAFSRLHYDYDRRSAEEGFKRAVELNPGYVTARGYALFLAQAARFDEAFIEIKRAQALDPLSLVTNYNIGVFFMLSRRYDEAIEQFRKTIELDPSYFMAHAHLGYTYALKGMFEQSRSAYQESANLPGGDLHGLYGMGLYYAMSGKRKEAQKLLGELKEMANHRHILPVGIAQIYVQLGETDQAFEWLERAYGGRDPWLVWIKVNPVFDEARPDPRFQDLLRRVGLL